MKKAKAVATIAAILCLSLALLLCVPPARTQQQEHKSPSDAILRQLFAALDPVPQGTCTDDTVLKVAYTEKNRLYFAGRLPADVIVCWDSELPQVNLLGYTDMRTPDGGFRVRLSPVLLEVGNMHEIILLHEMVHVCLARRGVAESHGKDFHKEMRRLARQGAFDELW